MIPTTSRISADLPISRSISVAKIPVFVAVAADAAVTDRIRENAPI